LPYAFYWTLETTGVPCPSLKCSFSAPNSYNLEDTYTPKKNTNYSAYIFPPILACCCCGCFLWASKYYHPQEEDEVVLVMVKRVR
jgi:hypothetical protein